MEHDPIENVLLSRKFVDASTGINTAWSIDKKTRKFSILTDIRLLDKTERIFSSLCQKIYSLFTSDFTIKSKVWPGQNY